ncbi:MAG TPA: winged helix-turn-helix transcriptional regulator, partial [Candidatus Thermoplasmatota archaeon]|nr:winged helix-turn-helix transcriptional regulator [Candidatus Thermoplasmatota archaeon]
SPRRYAELQPLLRGRNTNVLNKALKSLVSQGLLDQYGDRTDGTVLRYQLTSLGVAARDAIVELRFAERVRTALSPARSSAPT